MEIEYGDKRSQIIIAGILVLCVVAIFVGFALVIGVSKTNPQNGILNVFDKVLHNSDIGLIRCDTDVSAGNGGCYFDVPTETGQISFLSANFPPASWTELPLCITDADIANWYITLTVTGGYVPLTGHISFTQEGVEQFIYINWAEAAFECYSEWTATFVTDDGCIEFVSSQLPNVDLPFDFNGPCGSDFEEKLVDICWCTGWIGCDFYIMLIHKKYLYGIPQLPIEFHRQL